MTKNFTVNAVGRDNAGADFITLDGNNAEDVAGGLAIFQYEDGTTKSAVVISAYNNGAFTEVTLAPHTLDFTATYLTINVYTAAGEPDEDFAAPVSVISSELAERSLLSKLTFGILGK